MNTCICVFNQRQPNSLTLEFVSRSESSPKTFYSALTIDFLNANSVMSGEEKD